MVINKPNISIKFVDYSADQIFILKKCLHFLDGNCSESSYTCPSFLAKNYMIWDCPNCINIFKEKTGVEITPYQGNCPCNCKELSYYVIEGAVMELIEELENE